MSFPSQAGSAEGLSHGRFQNGTAARRRGDRRFARHRRACAERLATEKYCVAVLFGNNSRDADEVVATITAAGGQATAVEAGVADPVAAAAAFDTVGDLFGGVDVVVHAAGIRNPQNTKVTTSFEFVT